MIHIISPHIDDAVLSMGGIIQILNNKKEQIVIQNIFTISDWSNPEAICKKKYGKKAKVITELRKKEEIKVANILEYDYQFLDFKDFPLREGFKESDKCVLIEEITFSLSKKIRKGELCIFPSALGEIHPDHEIIGLVAKGFVAMGYLVYYYEDLPYTAQKKHDYSVTFRTMTNSGYYPKNFEIDINHKEQVLRHYKSQMCDEYLDFMKSYSYNLLDCKHYERLWIANGSKFISHV